MIHLQLALSAVDLHFFFFFVAFYHLQVACTQADFFFDTLHLFRNHQQCRYDKSPDCSLMPPAPYFATIRSINSHLPQSSCRVSSISQCPPCFSGIPFLGFVESDTHVSSQLRNLSTALLVTIFVQTLACPIQNKNPTFFVADLLLSLAVPLSTYSLHPQRLTSPIACSLVLHCREL